MTVREESLLLEEKVLSPFATLCKNTKGRVTPEEPCPVRTDFQRDRDRILHCNSFRRLMHKTQVFLNPVGDHYRTRLTHTLEVSQIARTMARGLRLNEDLTEAIALGHDLGHTPFGHTGEAALTKCSPYTFLHSEQSVRVVEKLERDGRGLNLCLEVVDGIKYHSSGLPWANTPEGRIVRYADKFAYINHDTDDAVRAGILTENDIPWDVRYTLGATRNQRLTSLITSVINNSKDGNICLDAETEKQYKELKAFLFQTVYKSPVAKAEAGKAESIVCALYEYFVKNPDKLPDDLRKIREEEGVERAAMDHIAGMSDRYCVNMYSELFLPKSWGY